MYSDLIKNSNIKKIETPSTFVPKPDETDYVDGFITRYFAQKANESNGPVYEIESQTFSEIKRNPFWKAVSINWKIAGSSMTKKNDIELIKKYNRDSIGKAKLVISNIHLYLVDLLQFSVNRTTL